MVRKLHLKEGINLSEYEYVTNRNGYSLYRKTVNGKGVWVAVGEDDIPFEITYDQARGFEPINPMDNKIQKIVAKALKMESIKLGDTIYSKEDIEDAVAYAYGLKLADAVKAVSQNKYNDKEIKKALIYWELKDLPYRSRQVEFRKRCKEVSLEGLSMKESIYTDLGYKNRENYLRSLADDYDVDINTVKELAYALGPEEDFDALVSEIEDLADDYEEDEKDPLQYYLDTYDYVVCSTDNTYKNYDFIFPYDTYKFAKQELARDLVTYKTETCLFDKERKTKTNYSPDKLDVSKLNPGGHGWVEEDEDYINPKNVGDTVAQQNIDSILRMCRVGTEKY